MIVADDAIAYSADDLTRVLPLGRASCFKLARQIGVRVGRRLVVSRSALEQWLASQPRNSADERGRQ
jgi:hypothetical protein